MANLLQQQLLKAGVVTKQQVKKAQSSKKKNKGKKNQKPVNEAALKAQQAAKEKAERDRALNQKKDEQARQKAISAEIDQLIKSNMIKRGEDCDIRYHFEHRNKVNHIHVDAEMRQKIINGQLGIARIEGRYELVPHNVAEKIQQRNEKRIVLFEAQEEQKDENDPYADFPIPDDLVW